MSHSLFVILLFILILIIYVYVYIIIIIMYGHIIVMRHWTALTISQSNELVWKKHYYYYHHNCMVSDVSIGLWSCVNSFYSRNYVYY